MIIFDPVDVLKFTTSSENILRKIYLGKMLYVSFSDNIMCTVTNVFSQFLAVYFSC